MAERLVLPQIPLRLAGDPKGDLEALRDRLVAEIERSDGSAVAALSKQLTDVLGKLASMPDAKEQSAADELANRRAARRSKASQSAAAGVKRGTGSD